MPLSNEILGIKADSLHSGLVLEKIRDAVGLSQRDWLDILEINSDDHKSILKGQTPLPAHVVEKIADHFDLTFDSVFFDQVDYSLLAKRFRQNQSTLPYRYSIGTHSRLRTSLHLMTISHGASPGVSRPFTSSIPSGTTQLGRGQMSPFLRAA